MSNRRFIVLFLVGILCLSAALVFRARRAHAVATAATRNTLCMCDPADVVALDVQRRTDAGTHSVRLVRDEQSAWHLVAPYQVPADPEIVARLVDAVSLMPFGANRSGVPPAMFAEYGLDAQARAVLIVQTRKGTVTTNFLGHATSTGEEVYARVEGLQNIFTLPAKALDAVPADANGFRRRALVIAPQETFNGLDLRAPGVPFVKLVRSARGWDLAEPLAGPADAAAVTALAAGLAKAKISDFVLTSSTNRSDEAGAALKPAQLAQYGLSSDTRHEVAVRTVNGATEQIVFGAPAGTNLVYALVRNGTTVVKVAADVADLCRASGASFRDQRAFPLAENERVESISFTVGSSVYLLAQDTNKVWHLESPVVADADAKCAAAFVETVLKLRVSEVPNVAPDQGAVSVSLTTSLGARAGKVVPEKIFASCGAFADLRAKTLLSLDAASVRRITVTPAEGPATTVSRTGAREIWCLDMRTDGQPANVKSEVVKALLATLTQVEAERVETVAATPLDRRRCALEQPYLTVAIDFFDTGSPRRNLLIGGAVSNGARYATVGGADAIFILSRATVQALAVKLTEQDHVRKD